MYDKKKVVGTFLFFALVISILAFSYFERNKANTVIDFSSLEASESKEIAVDISGAVETPGLVTLESGSRLSDAIEKVGGLREDSASLWVSQKMNLSEILEDSKKVYIPFEWELVANEIVVSRLIYDEGQVSTDKKETATTSKENTLINVNTAGVEELVSLKGVGEAYAQKIINNRPYASYDEFLEKSGIPESTANNAKDLISY